MKQKNQEQNPEDRTSVSLRIRFFLVFLCFSGVKKAMFGDEHVTSPAAFLFLGRNGSLICFLIKADEQAKSRQLQQPSDSFLFRESV